MVTKHLSLLKQTGVIIVLMWLLIVVLLIKNSGEDSEQIAKQLGKAMNQLEMLKKQNEEFKTLLADFRQIGIEGRPCSDQAYQQLQQKLDKANSLNKDDDSIKDAHPLDTKGTQNEGEGYRASSEVERIQRRIYRGVKELWYFVSAELKKLKKLSTEDAVQKKIGELLEDGAEHKRTIYVDFYNLSQANGRFEWVKKEIKELEEIVERRIIALQNPSDCNSTKKIIYNLNYTCGFGCHLHHVLVCLIFAYGIQRPFILNSHQWNYSPTGWESVFLPLSNNCVSSTEVNTVSWPSNDSDLLITFGQIVYENTKYAFVPLAIPEDLSGRLLAVHGDPSVWWIGQFVKYLMRPNQILAKYLEELMAKMDFQRPIVGVHVRRTDKIIEASFHSIEEYMDHVTDYYAYLQLKGEVDVKRVYLATDDPTVFDEARKKYPDYVFLGDPNATESASESKRYSVESLKGIVGDIYMLAHTDYVVCTFSSQVCKIVYELMQTVNADPSGNVRSLDDLYFLGGQQDRHQRVMYDHVPRFNSGEIELKRGDVIHVAGNHYDGYSLGVNLRTKIRGLYPSFKVDEIIRVFEEPFFHDTG